MPLHNFGYRTWNESRTLAWSRWTAIAWSGICLAWRNTWLQRTLMFTWAPALLAIIAFFTYEQALLQNESRRFLLRNLLRNSRPELREAFLNDPASVRHEIWSQILMTYFRYPQAIVVVLLVALIAPKLIAYDLRSRAMLLYFSRPIDAWQYVLGKSAIIWFYLGMVTTVPALVVYLMGILFSTEWQVVQTTWDLPFRILAASALLILPTASVALAYSSLTVESRYATIAWIATWVMGAVAYGVLTASTNRGPRPWRERGSDWLFVSPYHALGVVQQWIFGLHDTSTSVMPYFMGILVVTLGAQAIIFYRLLKAVRV